MGSRLLGWGVAVRERENKEKRIDRLPNVGNSPTTHAMICPTEMLANAIKMSADNKVALYKLAALFSGSGALEETNATDMVRQYLAAAKTISETPALYVRELFDQYADTFDAE